MAKKYGLSDTQIKKRIKEGRGSGRDSNYLPWVKVNEVPSLGRSHRVFGHKSQRTHHLLSNLELSVFLLFEWHKDTIEIREQFPLRQEETLALAKDGGYILAPAHNIQSESTPQKILELYDYAAKKGTYPIK